VKKLNIILFMQCILSVWLTIQCIWWLQKRLHGNSESWRGCYACLLLLEPSVEIPSFSSAVSEKYLPSLLLLELQKAAFRNNDSVSSDAERREKARSSVTSLDSFSVLFSAIEEKEHCLCILRSNRSIYDHRRAWRNCSTSGREASLQ